MEGVAKITKIEKVRHEEPVKVYNFDLKEWASYFVSEMQIYGHNGIGVHRGNEAVDGLKDPTNGKGVAKNFELSGGSY